MDIHETSGGKCLVSSVSSVPIGIELPPIYTSLPGDGADEEGEEAAGGP